MMLVWLSTATVRRTTTGSTPVLGSYVSAARWTEQRPPKPQVHVRIVPGTLRRSGRAAIAAAC